MYCDYLLISDVIIKQINWTKTHIWFDVFCVYFIPLKQVRQN